MNKSQLLQDLESLSALLGNKKRWARRSVCSSGLNDQGQRCYCFGGGMIKIAYGLTDKNFRQRYHHTMWLDERVIAMYRALGFEYSHELIRYNDSEARAYSALKNRLNRAIEKMTWVKKKPGRKPTEKIPA